MTLYLANAFSLSMLDRETQNGYWPHVASPASCPDLANRKFVSCVGHADTAALLSKLVNAPVKVNRASVKLGPDDQMFVGQYVGPRLPEGATELPEGASIEWWFLRTLTLSA